MAGEPRVGPARAADSREVLFIQFAKMPRPGLVKTRMIPSLSAEQACDLHKELLLWTCRTLCAARQATAVELWVTDAPGTEPEHLLIGQCRNLGVDAIRQQRSANLGERMYQAIQHGLTRYSQVVLIGSDCPAIDADYLAAAVEALTEHALVLGPANDGGYVLIGARQIQPELFTDIPWGTDRVYRATVERLRMIGLSWAELASLPDIDRPDDLKGWLALRERGARLAREP